MLPDTVYPRHAVHEIRGEAWKERANALDALGRYPEAFEALNAAEIEYRCLPHPGAGIVSLTYIRSSLLYEQEHFADAERFATESARAALHLGLTDRYMRARHLLALIRSDQHRYGEALDIARDLLERGEATGDEVWVARESLVVGGCELELGNLKEADKHLIRARALHSSLGSSSEVIRTDWCIARLKARAGETKEAIRRLRGCIVEFSRLEMLTDAALVAVDLAELLVAAEREREVPAVLAGVSKRFTEAGKLTSALTALAYLSHAAASATPISPQVIGYVRRFILRADRDHELMFAPPAEPGT
ncbi:MAG TPA: hypothetical protein VEK11_25675 [Thermoanaerobaculia bacterium]|nr:hypothetical protein [Thermoanaerobaculia bacterium]